MSLHKSESEQSESARATVVLMITRLHGGGAERAVAAMANAWARQGKAVHVILTVRRSVNLEDEYEDEYKVDANVTRYYLGRTTWLGRIRRKFPILGKQSLVMWDGVFRILSAMGALGDKIAYGITRWRRRHIVAKVQAILAKLDDPILFVFTAQLYPIALLACEADQTKFVAMERNDFVLGDAHAEVSLFRPIACKEAVMVTANSRSALRELAKFTAQEKLSYIPNPLFKSEALQMPINEDEREPIILILPAPPS